MDYLKHYLLFMPTCFVFNWGSIKPQQAPNKEARPNSFMLAWGSNVSTKLKILNYPQGSVWQNTLCTRTSYTCKCACACVSTSATQTLLFFHLIGQMRYIVRLIFNSMLLCLQIPLCLSHQTLLIKMPTRIFQTTN